MNMSRDISMKKVYPNPAQPRKYFDDVYIEELAQSINEHGLLNPIMVTPNERGFQIVHGECRWRACDYLGHKTIRAEVRELDGHEAYLISLVENVQRNDLSPIDEGEAYQRLLGGMTQVELADKIGKTQPYIATKLRLLNLPAGVSWMVRTKALSEGHAKQLLKLKNLYPDGLEAYPRFNEKFMSRNILKYGEAKQRFIFMTLMDLGRVMANVPFLASTNAKILDGDISLDPFLEFWPVLANTQQWELAAFWWGINCVAGELPVITLSNILNTWHELYEDNVYLFSRDPDIDERKLEVMRHRFVDLAYSSSLGVEVEGDESTKIMARMLKPVHPVEGDLDYDVVGPTFPSSLQWRTTDRETESIPLDNIKAFPIPLDDMMHPFWEMIAYVEMGADYRIVLKQLKQ